MKLIASKLEFVDRPIPGKLKLTASKLKFVDRPIAGKLKVVDRPMVN